jgi:hypothetical protein
MSIWLACWDQANLVTWFECIVGTFQTRSWLSKFKGVECETVRDAAAKCPLQVVGVKIFRQVSFRLGEKSGMGGALPISQVKLGMNSMC